MSARLRTAVLTGEPAQWKNARPGSFRDGRFCFFGGRAGCGERRLDIIQNMGRSPAVYRGHVDNRFLARMGGLYSCDDCICLVV